MATDVTRTRLLDAAERLLATTSYADLKVRAVCVEAGVNPASVHYHFGSRENLVTALLQDRLGPVWADPLDELAARHPTVREIVDAILAPLLRLSENTSYAPHLTLLGGFVMTHPDAEWTATWFRTDVWATLLTHATGVDERTARRRWQFAFSLLMTELSIPQRLTPWNVAALGDFLTAGLNGPNSSSPDSNGRSPAEPPSKDE